MFSRNDSCNQIPMRQHRSFWLSCSSGRITNQKQIIFLRWRIAHFNISKKLFSKNQINPQIWSFQSSFLVKLFKAYQVFKMVTFILLFSFKLKNCLDVNIAHSQSPYLSLPQHRFYMQLAGLLEGRRYHYSRPTTTYLQNSFHPAIRAP